MVSVGINNTGMFKQSGLVGVITIYAFVICFVDEIVFITAAGVRTIHRSVGWDITFGYAGRTAGKYRTGGCAINATR